MGKLRVGEGQKFDATQVSAEGLSAQEIAEIIKKNNKFINIYNAYNTDGKEGLTQIELAAAMDDFLKTSGDDNKISRRDFNKMAEEFNRTHGLSGDKKVSGRDLKGFFKSVIEATRNDEKVSTQQVLDEQNRRYEQMLKEMQEDMQARERRQGSRQSVVELDPNLGGEIDKLKENVSQHIEEMNQSIQKESEKKEDLMAPKEYTVQLNDSFRGLIKKSLKSQDIEITEENMNAAIKEFKRNNPNAVHSQNGVEYLYAGAVVKIAGNLENKNNAEAVIKSYQEAIGGNSSRHETPNEKKTPAAQEPVVKRNPPAEVNPEPRVYHAADADPTTGKLDNEDFVLFNDSVMTKYDPAKKGYVAYTGLRDGKYYENGEKIQLAQKQLVDYDKEKFGKNYNTPEYRKYYTYSYYNNNNSTATLTPAQEDPTYDSNVQIKIGRKTFELERKLTVNLAGSSYDYNDFIEDFVDTETGTISAKEISNDSYFLTSGKERYNVTIDKETGALMVEINGKKVDLNDLMTGKATI